MGGCRGEGGGACRGIVQRDAADSEKGDAVKFDGGGWGGDVAAEDIDLDAAELCRAGAAKLEDLPEGVCDAETEVEGVSLGVGAKRGVEVTDSEGGAPGVSDGLGLPLAEGVPVCEGDMDGAEYVHDSATSPVWPA